MKFSKNIIEWSTVTIILVLFLALQWNAISKGHYAAQDYAHHCGITRLSAESPWKALTTPCGCGTTASLYEFVAGRIYKLEGEQKTFFLMGIINCLANTVALFLFYLLIRKIICCTLIRISCLTFIAFLPITVITSVAFAADASTSLFFISIVWVGILIIMKLYENKGSPFKLMTLEGCLLILISTFRFTYSSCVLGIFIIGLILTKQGLFKRSTLWRGALILIVMPIIIILFYAQVCVIQQNTDFTRVLKIKSTVFWNIHNLVPHRADLDLLQAPYCFQKKTVDGKGINHLSDPKNFYSYPTLLHLGIFSDVMNIYQPTRLTIDDNRPHEPYEYRFRSENNQQRMSLAVHTGLIFTAIFILSIFWLGRKLFLLAWQKKLNKNDYYIVVPLVLSLSVFFIITASFPKYFILWAAGLWWPRYILPVVLCFGIFLFMGIEKLLKRSVPAQIGVLILTMFQTFLHISFLWITG